MQNNRTEMQKMATRMQKERPGLQLKNGNGHVPIKKGHPGTDGLYHYI